jgi:lysophospholipase L1-like esterase
MRFTTFATVCLGAVQAQAAQYTDYFFRYAGGNDIINGQRLRGNNSIDFYSPGVTHAPYNPEDRKPAT